jgi:hypothetical protein
MISHPASEYVSDCCPIWCQHEHLGEGSDSAGFHHDGPVDTVSLEEELVPGRTLDLYVNVSQHAQTGVPDEPTMVEVQDDHRTLALLTPFECVQLSRALLDAAAVCVKGEQDARARTDVMVDDLERLLRTSYAILGEAAVVDLDRAAALTAPVAPSVPRAV